MSEINICGVLLHVKPIFSEPVQKTLCAMAGVEVHKITAQGRMIITIEGESRGYVADTLSEFNRIEGVLSASLVYQFSDTDEFAEGVTA